MSKRLLIAAAVVLVAATSGATFAVTAAADSRAEGKGKLIRLVACGDLDQEDIDLPGPGQVGDLRVGTADFCNAAGSEVGFVRFTCVFNVGTGVMCTNHLTLDGRGQIVTMQSGDPAEGPMVTEAVVGGTGEFRNSRGEATVDFSAGPPKVTIRLIG
ncbi:MAG: hypothetical protein ACRELC_01235 [Gemmatimonadota bacterium]